MDWQELQQAVLGGQGLPNDAAALLLPRLSGGDQDVAALEASGALCLLGPEESAQVRRRPAALPTCDAPGDAERRCTPTELMRRCCHLQYSYMAERARISYNSTAGQQRGVLVCALASRMGASLQGSRRARMGKRPRTDAADAAQPLHFPPKQSPGNATTFHPSPPAAPTMAVRRFTYLGIPSALRERHDMLDEQARELPRTDPQRKEIKQQINQLPGAFRVSHLLLPPCVLLVVNSRSCAATAQWQVAEFQPVRAVEAAQQLVSLITAVEMRGGLLWLTVQNMPDLVVGAIQCR